MCVLLPRTCEYVSLYSKDCRWVKVTDQGTSRSSGWATCNPKCPFTWEREADNREPERWQREQDWLHVAGFEERRMWLEAKGCR